MGGNPTAVLSEMRSGRDAYSERSATGHAHQILSAVSIDSGDP